MLLSTKLPWDLASTRWSSILNPILKNPVTNPTLLNDVSLSIGDNIINHRLGTTQQGWFIIDVTAAAKIYRNAPFNDKTLTLHSDTACTINLGVF